MALVLVLVLGTSSRAAEALKFPAGPAGTERFGAYTTRLAYEPAWDAPWRSGPRADIVVRFDRFDARLIFWRGTNCVPCWVNEDRKWYTDGGVGRAEGRVQHDRWCRYSRAIVVEESDARVVVIWKYAPVSKAGELLHADGMTNWHDWVEETYTIYPDGVGVRKMTLWSSNWDSPVALQESTILNEPGTSPEDNIALAAITRADMLGRSRTYSWADSRPEALTAPPWGNIQIVHLAGEKGRKPFQAVFPSDSVSLSPIPKSERSGRFEIERDWPLEGTADPARDRPTSTAISRLHWAPSSEGWQRRTWAMMLGLTEGGPAEVAALVRSWIQAPVLSVRSGAYVSLGYDPHGRAYELRAEEAGKPTRLRVEIAASEASPVRNVALAIRGWGRAEARLSIDGTPVPRGTSFRYGFRKTLAQGDLIAWIERETEKPVVLVIEPVSAGKEGAR